MPLLVLAFIFVILSGCTPSSSRKGTTADVAVTDDTKAMVGKWGAFGDRGPTFLIVSRVGGRIVLAAPENETWRIDFRDARLDGNSICYTQESFLHSGEYHPFNGVEVNTTIRLIDADTMEMKQTTVNLDTGTYQLKRIK